jgi:hypothetical protein
MRKIIFLGTTAVALAFGAANALAMGGGDLSPEQSPYALIAPQTLQQPPIGEGRAAFTGDEQGYWAGHHAGRHSVARPDDGSDYSPER